MEKGKRLFFERYPSLWRSVLPSFLAIILLIFFRIGLTTEFDGSKYPVIEYLSNIILKDPLLCILFSLGIYLLVCVDAFLPTLRCTIYENGIEVGHRFIKWQDIAEITEMKSFKINSSSNNNILVKLAPLGLSWRYMMYRLIMFGKRVSHYSIHLKDDLFFNSPHRKKR